ncbi:MAG: enoyl-CoA hydratase/isomerase family protein [Nitrososphaerota archaeon]
MKDINEQNNLKEYSDIDLKIESPLAWIILNRPQKLNAITPRMIMEIDDALNKLRDNSDVKVIIFMGSGEKAFSAGADIALLKEADDASIRHNLTIRLSEVLMLIEKYPKPIIAAIRGYALGGGLELALACDFRLASENSIIGLPEINLGLLPAGGGMQRLIKNVGIARAKEIAMLGELIDCNEAKRVGLITKILSNDNFVEEVKKFALKIAELPQLALKAIKLSILAESEPPYFSGQILESFVFELLIASRDSKERINAFLEQRNK